MNKQKDNKHVVFYLPSLVGGGAENVVVKLIAGFEQKGHRVSLIVNKKIGVLVDEIPQTVDIYDFGTNNPITIYQCFKKLMPRLMPDILFSNLPVPNIISALYNRLHNPDFKICLIQHSILSVIRKSKNKPLRLRMRLWLMRKVYKYADHIVCISKAIAQDIQDLTNVPIGRIKIIYNPVVSDDLKTKAEKTVDHHWFSDELDHPILVKVARFEYPKDFETIVRALVHLRKQDVIVRLCLIGHGKDYNKIQDLIKEYALEDLVWMPGYLQNPYAVITKSDLSIFSSHYEGFGLSMVEAMALNIPVIASRSEGGIKEIIGENEERGNFFEYKDAQDLADKIKHVLLSNKDRKILGEAKKYADQFTFDKTLSAYEAFLD